MAISQMAEYQVTAEGVEEVKRAIREFVDYVRAAEPDADVQGLAAAG